MIQLDNFLLFFFKYTIMNCLIKKGNLQWWLLLEDAYDQYAITTSDIVTSVYLNTPVQPKLLESREVCMSYEVCVLMKDHSIIHYSIEMDTN